MIDAPYLPVLLAASLCILIFISNRLDKVIQPMRLILAEKGEALLKNPHLNDRVKSSINRHINNAFGNKYDLIKEIIYIPFFAIILLFQMKRIKKIITENKIDDKSTRVDAMEFFKLSEEIKWFNNPVLMTIVNVEFYFLVSIAILIRAVLLNGFNEVEKWTVIPTLEGFKNNRANHRSIGVT